MPGNPSAAAWASAAVRRFAAATNLLVAGRRFTVVGDGHDARELRALLVRLGAREVPAGDADGGTSGDGGGGAAVSAALVDQLWCVGDPADSERAVEAQLHRPRGHSLVVIDAGRHAPAVDEDAWGPMRLVRPGVLSTPALSDDVFFVSTGRDPEDDPAAEQRIRWAGRFMPVSRETAADLRTSGLLRGVRIGVAMVLEPKTAVLSLLLLDAGADVVVYAHADETDDAVGDALRNAGLVVFASSTATTAEQRSLALEMLDREPQIVVDDGAHVIRLAHEERPDLFETMLGAAEETTSGLTPLRIMHARGDLRVPVIAVNDARAKTLFDNRYGTGQSCVFAVLDLLDAAVAAGPAAGGRTDSAGPGRAGPGRALGAGDVAVVAGFGHVGEGVARTLAALGFRIVVAERDPVRALQAVFAGYDVAPLVDAVASAHLVVSATGVTDTISLDVLRACAPDAVVAVAGGVPQEVATDAADRAGATRTAIGHKVERVELPGGTCVRLLDDGGCINITAAEGNPVEIMDLSFAVQLGAIRTLLESGDDLGPGVHPIDVRVDDRIARAALGHVGITIDPAVRPAASTADPVGAAMPDVDVRTTRFG